VNKWDAKKARKKPEKVKTSFAFDHFWHLSSVEKQVGVAQLPRQR
jgi:hypothetical protein